jgi:hypothetical protein
MTHKSIYRLFSSSIILLVILACNALAPVATPTAMPSTIPPTATSAPLLSQQLTMTGRTSEETNQTPPFRITAQTPELTGSDDPRLTVFNQRLSDLIRKEVGSWRQSFLQNTLPDPSGGSTLDATYTLVSRIGDLWSFKFDFNFYSTGAAHPGLYSTTLNYDLAQGKELGLADLFLPSSNYLETISQHCITELSKQPGFEGPFADGAQPTLENYRNWNITPDGLLITFDAYQVAPGAAGPIQVLVPYDQLRGLINPQGVIASFAQ